MKSSATFDPRERIDEGELVIDFHTIERRQGEAEKRKIGQVDEKVGNKYTTLQHCSSIVRWLAFECITLVLQQRGCNRRRGNQRVIVVVDVTIQMEIYQSHRSDNSKCNRDRQINEPERHRSEA